MYSSEYQYIQIKQKIENIFLLSLTFQTCPSYLYIKTSTANDKDIELDKDSVLQARLQAVLRRLVLSQMQEDKNIN